MGMKDCEVIKEFVSYLREKHYPGLQVDHWPEQEYPGQSLVDAIAGPLAIEHTSIDTLPNQRRRDHWFMQLMEPLVEELADKMQCRLEVVSRYGAVRKGQDPEDIRSRIRAWVNNDLDSIPEDTWRTVKIPCVPFELGVWKSTTSDPGFFPGRYSPDQDPGLPSRIQKLFEDHAQKLMTNQRRGKTAVLLLECPDSSLMNPWLMRRAI